jgi:hypothetical protein
VEPACVVGAVKTPEREQIGKFTHPLYQALPIVALSLADNARLASGRPLQRTLADPELKLLAKEGYSFGSFVSAALARTAARIEVARATTELLRSTGRLLERRGIVIDAPTLPQPERTAR